MSGKQTPSFNLNLLTPYSLFKVHGEDGASVLTSNVTFKTLLATAAFLSAIQLIGDPIECLCPAELTVAMCNYTKSICWVSKQYVIDMDTAIPSEPGLRQETLRRQMGFYAFVPFIILTLAALLKLPTFLYSAWQAENGLNILSLVKGSSSVDLDTTQSVVQVARDMSFFLKTRYLKNVEDNQRRRAHITPHFLTLKEFLTGLLFFFCGVDCGTYQTGLYMVTKLLTLVTTILAYPGLSYALQEDFTAWGWELFKAKILNMDLSGASGVTESERHLHFFPRETLCDFKVRYLSNIHKYTVQCVLPVNMWTEKVFLVLWFWLVVLIVANAYSYQYWFRKLLIESSRFDLVKKHLLLKDTNMKKEGQMVANFVREFLSYDSILALRILEMSAGNQFSCDLVYRLFQDYKELEHNTNNMEEQPSTDSSSARPSVIVNFSEIDSRELR